MATVTFRSSKALGSGWSFAWTFKFYGNGVLLNPPPVSVPSQNVENITFEVPQQSYDLTIEADRVATKSGYTECSSCTSVLVPAAVINPTSFTVTLQVGTNGKVNNSSNQQNIQVNAGESLNFTTQPNVGYSVKGTPTTTCISATVTGSNNSYTVGPINNTCQVFIEFSSSSFNLGSCTSPNGNIYADAVIFSCSNGVPITAVAAGTVSLHHTVSGGQAVDEYSMYYQPGATYKGIGFACSGLEVLKINQNTINTFPNSTTTAGILQAQHILPYGAANATSGTSTTGYDIGTSSAKFRNIYCWSVTQGSSDIRLKTNIEASNLGLDFILKLNPVSFDYKEYDGKKYYGLIAQELKTVLDDEGVSNFAGWKLMNPEDLDSEQNISYDSFVGPLIKAVQELHQENLDLEKEINLIKQSLNIE